MFKHLILYCYLINSIRTRCYDPKAGARKREAFGAAGSQVKILTLATKRPTIFSQETASQAKKIAKESENSVRLAQERVKDLERELSKVVSHRDELEERGDFANQESAKIKHMLLLGNYVHVWKVN